jgi:hypothetical protein
VVHFVSDSPAAGPWIRQGVVLPAQATCPSAAVAPDGTLILTLFGGEERTSKQRTREYYPNGDPVNHNFCRNGSTPCGFSKHGCFNSSSSSSSGGATLPIDHHPSHANSAVGSNDCAHCKTEQCSDNCTFPIYAYADGVNGLLKSRLAHASILLDKKNNPTGFKGTFSISVRVCACFVCVCVRARPIPLHVLCSVHSRMPSRTSTSSTSTLSDSICLILYSRTNASRSASTFDEVSTSVLSVFAHWRMWISYLSCGVVWCGVYPTICVVQAPWIAKNGTTHILLQTGEFPTWFPANMSVNNIGAVVRADAWQGPYVETTAAQRSIIHML